MYGSMTSPAAKVQESPVSSTLLSCCAFAVPSSPPTGKPLKGFPSPQFCLFRDVLQMGACSRPSFGSDSSHLV